MRTSGTLFEPIDHSRFGYARVSTRGQPLEVQLAALVTAGAAPADVFAEKKCGKAGSARPQREDVRSRLRPHDSPWSANWTGWDAIRARSWRPRGRCRTSGRSLRGRRGQARRPVISKDMMRIALGRRADGESVASIAKGLTYKTAGGEERTVSRRALYNAFKATTPSIGAGTATSSRLQAWPGVSSFPDG
ncbi:recombinase family protein [Nonomuraea angiospora]|uniref:recombinase family protein n=1 Tax=Nonomuraea angiospora TaxID=46172 RepID=UPI0033318432